MRIFESMHEWQYCRRDIQGEVGFVPTMGALHGGHLSLVRRSLQENAHTVVSIFVNPTQFNNPKDLESYPVDLKRDEGLLRDLGVHTLLLPKREELYGDGYRFKVSESKDSLLLEGAHRPGHFDGVLTVVLKLFNLVQARRAYFGEKDYQQLELIRGMAQALFLRTEVLGCPTQREKDGLAMSSRNLLLSKEARAQAPRFSKALREAPDASSAERLLKDQGFEVDYVEEQWGRRLGAVTLDGVRLIDNV